MYWFRLEKEGFNALVLPGERTLRCSAFAYKMRTQCSLFTWGKGTEMFQFYLEGGGGVVIVLVVPGEGSLQCIGFTLGRETITYWHYLWKGWL